MILRSPTDYAALCKAIRNVASWRRDVAHPLYTGKLGGQLAVTKPSMESQRETHHSSLNRRGSDSRIGRRCDFLPFYLSKT